MSKRKRGNSVPDRAAVPGRFLDKSTNEKAHQSKPGGWPGEGTGTDPRPREGSGTDPRVRRAERPLLDSEENPQCDNMGVINDSLALVGYRFRENTERIGNPADYFHKIAPDTLQLSISCDPIYDEAISNLLAMRTLSEKMQASGGGNVRIYCHLGNEFDVFPHGAKPAYQILMRGGDEEHIRAISMIKNMPKFIVRLGARTCNELTREQIKTWVIEFLRHLGFSVRLIKLSELHLRVDVPYPFSRRELERVSGTGTRNSKVAATYHPMTPNDIEDFSNRGGKPKFVVDIYDKRIEQAGNKKPFWKSVWEAYGIPENSSITRIEFRAKRDTLRSYGLETLDDLTDEAMRGIWHDATNDYFYLAKDPTKGLPTYNSCIYATFSRGDLRFVGAIV
ncbi:MAG: hypothetical protein BMS9Abin05_2654 [Rhodothermia bacterium]|nr:MAG: hypothetical protein BMS9Abin05_2654 [Rhodothermia bacterium]